MAGGGPVKPIDPNHPADTSGTASLQCDAL
jgi:hypothetical protein